MPYSYPPYTQLGPAVDHRFSDKDFVFGRYNWRESISRGMGRPVTRAWAAGARYATTAG